MNHPRLLQSLCWLAFLALILFNGDVSTYISSRQRGMTSAALMVFTLLLLIDTLLHREHAQEDAHAGHDHGPAVQEAQRPWLITAVHCLPLFLLLVMGTTTLGAQSLRSLRQPLPGMVKASVATSRPAAVTGLPVIAERSSVPASSPVLDPDLAPAVDGHLQGASASAAARPVGVELAPPAQPPALAVAGTAAAPATALNLLDLYYQSEHPGVSRVAVIGRVMVPTPEMLKDLPPGLDAADAHLFLYRFLVTCCAADAQPVLAVLKHAPQPVPAVDTWVRVIGKWVPPKDIGDITMLEVESLTIVPAPADPYLHPVWR